MRQHYNQYTKDDHEVWATLFERQTTNLVDKACTEYLHCLDDMGQVLNETCIPDFRELDRLLMRETGWSIEVVPGHIPVDRFFRLLSLRRFPSSTWLRSLDQLDYIEEPDMFHDIYGHIPLLMHERYANFMQQIGKLGVEWVANPVALASLRSLYWFTIEFGMLQKDSTRQIYGAGIISSFGESRRVLDMSTEHQAFDIEAILMTDFRTDTIQELYFDAKTFDEFLDSLGQVQAFLASLTLVPSSS